MQSDDETKSICARLLNLYRESDNVSSHEIDTLRTHKAQRYALTNLYSFFYKGTKYYVSNDYSLDDNPQYVENLIRDIDHKLNGRLLKNPTPQSDKAIYASGINGVEYYVWKCEDI